MLFFLHNHEVQSHTYRSSEVHCIRMHGVGLEIFMMLFCPFFPLQIDIKTSALLDQEIFFLHQSLILMSADLAI